jgi:hypothetical protein
MNMRSVLYGKAWLGALAGLLMLLFCACDVQITIPRMLDSETGIDMYDIALTVGNDGKKYLIWEEIDQVNDLHYLVYMDTLVGEQGEEILILPPSGEYADPDIAVTDNGLVYIVWVKMEADGDFVACYDIMPDATPECNLIDPSGRVKLHGYTPRVIAYENVVFTTYETEVGSYEYLYYRQLLPLGNTEGSATPAGCNFMGPYDIAVSEPTAGHYTLHVATKCITGNWVYYADNYGTTGDVIHSYGDVSEYGIFGEVYMTVTEDTGRVYWLYISDDSAIPGSWMVDASSCDIAGCPAPSRVTSQHLLDATKGWLIQGDQDITDDGTTVYYVFRARTDARANYEVYVIVYDSTYSVPVTASNVSNTDENESSPKIVWWDGPEATYLAAWRMTDGGNPVDVIVYDVLNGARTIFVSPLWYSSFRYELEANGEWIAGVWGDLVSADDDRVVPWMAMNGEIVYLPLIKIP